MSLEPMWECTCGHTEYGELAPEECPDCYSLNSFVQLPEELIAEREKDMVEHQMEDELNPLEKPSPKRAPKKKKLKRK